jgi:2'-5' RNA ligase
MTKRTFLAINLPNEIKEKLKEPMEKLKKLNPNHAIRWVSPENLHLTLHFFGDLNEKQIELAKEGIEEITKRHRSFSIVVTGEFGCFPNEQNPRVFFVKIKENKQIKDLIRELEVMLQNLKFKVDTRPWQGHITLGRIKNHAKCKTGDVKCEPLIFEVKSIELMESKLTPEGSIYSVIESFPLK